MFENDIGRLKVNVIKGRQEADRDMALQSKLLK